MKARKTVTVDELLYAYSNGIFPMADETEHIYWYSPEVRAIIPLENYKPQKSLRSVLRKKTFEIRFNTCFEEVMRQCAKPRKEEGNGVWISENMIKTYTQLHQMGYAHSVEAFCDGKLAGGLYGVSLGKAFFGESMFTRVSNASKVAFHYLVETLKTNQFVLLDSQFINDNVKRYGAIEIPASEFQELLEKALKG